MKTDLKTFYEDLSNKKKTGFMDDVTATCQISEPTFYRRLKMPWLYRRLEIEAIQNIAVNYNNGVGVKFILTTEIESIKNSR